MIFPLNLHETQIFNKLFFCLDELQINSKRSESAAQDSLSAVREMPSIEKIEELLEREPNDVFLNFGLAMALRSAGREDESLARFDRTCEIEPTYVAA